MENVYPLPPLFGWMLSIGRVTVPKCRSLWIAVLNAAMSAVVGASAGDEDGRAAALERNMVDAYAVRRCDAVDLGDQEIIFADLTFGAGHERDRLVEHRDDASSACDLRGFRRPAG